MCDSIENPAALTPHTGPTPELTSTATASVHTAAQSSPAVDIETTTTTPLQLGAIKELLQGFIRERQGMPPEQAELELRELYRFLCRQAQKAGIDPARVIELYRADAAKRQPKPVRS